MCGFSLGRRAVSPSIDSARSGTALALVLAIAAAIAFLVETWQIQSQIDDAYISFRYAKNLINGVGLVYNAGEYVEGMTNLLWTLLIAAGLELGFEANAVAHVLGSASGAATLLLSAAYALQGLRLPARWLAGLTPWIVWTFPGLVRWSESGLETSLFLACAVGTLAAAARGLTMVAVGAAILGTLTRPDGALLAAVVFGLPLLTTRFRDARAWRAPLVYAAAMLLLTAFRLYYYGQPVPNTFYAKVGGVPLSYGVSALWTFGRDGVWLLAAAALPGALWIEKLRPGAIYAALVAAYVVWTGGDVLGTDRLFLPAVPALAAIAVAGAARGYERDRRLGACLFGFVAAGTAWQLWGTIPLEVAVCGGIMWTAWLLSIALGQRRLLSAAAVGVAIVASVYVFGGFARRDFIDDCIRSSQRSRTIAKVRKTRRQLEQVSLYSLEMLRKQHPSPGLVALTGIGHFGYHSDLPILDLMGLVDETIAHSELPAPEGAVPVPGHLRSNADYVFSRKPDFILIGKKGPTTGIRAHIDIWNHPALERDYVWDPSVMGYRRRSVVTTAAPSERVSGR